MIVPGFRFAGIEAGIKKHGGLDLALMVADAPAAAAAVFTTNRVKAAPVLVSRQRLKSGRAQAILVNSGNANACTGSQGLADARELTRRAAELLNLPPGLVLPASTGVIGQPLPMQKIAGALADLARRLSSEGFKQAAEAIMTTDTRPKTAMVQGKIAGKQVTVAGMAKGAGMIHPSMATLLAFVFTDAAASPPALRALLREGVESTFNRITIDGDTSTNDMLVAMAGGKAGTPIILDPTSKDAAALQDLLTQVMADLARQVVADAEGARHLFTVAIKGAASPREARLAAATVATSPLVKTAMAGADVNWGRIMAALGRSGARFDPMQVDIAFGSHPVVQNGQGLGPAAEARAQKLILAGPVTVTIDLNAGPFQDFYHTCDLTEDYIRINASYRS